MNPQFKKYTVAFSFVLLLIAHLAHACGPSLYLNEGRFSLFSSGLDGFDGLEPFYYSESFINSYNPDPAGKDYQRNCEEWRKYCGNKASIEDIYLMQYKTNPTTFLNDIAVDDWSHYEHNTYIQWLRLSNHKEALGYFILSKKIESTQFGDSDPWREGGNLQYDKMCDYTDSAKALCLKTKDKFLRERYAFQALKMEYYCHRTGEVLEGEISALDLYKEYLSHSKSVVAGWAALFYGLRHADENIRTLYLLKAFDLSEEKKVFCYLYISPANMDHLLLVNKDKKVKELVYVLKAMRIYGRAFDQIKTLYNVNPGSKYLPMLISREINKMEDWIWSTDMLNFSTLGTDDDGKVSRAPSNREGVYEMDKYVCANRISDVKYLKEVRNFLSQIKIKHNESFRHLAIAHLYNMTKDYTDALLCLNKMPVFKNKRLETQRLIEWTIASAYTHNVRERSFQNRLAKNLDKLYVLNSSFAKRDSNANYYYYEGDYGTDEDKLEREDDFGELLLMLSNRFKEQGDIMMAGLLYNKANVLHNIYDGDRATSVSYGTIAYFDRNATVSTIDSLLRFMHKANKTRFERFAVARITAADDFYKDLKGTILMRKQKFHEALKVFMDIDTAFWQDNQNFVDYLPKSSITSLGTLSPWVTEVPAKYAYCSKALIVKDIVRIEDSLKIATLSNDHKAMLHYRLGNCLYNISYNGKAWMMESYGKTAREEISDKGDYAYYSFYPNNLRYGRNYYGCEAAKKEYQLSFELSSDREMKVWALLNLRLCEHSSFYTDDKEISPYLIKLNKSFEDSRTYQMALSVCPDITDNVKHFKQ